MSRLHWSAAGTRATRTPPAPQPTTRSRGDVPKRRRPGSARRSPRPPRWTPPRWSCSCTRTPASSCEQIIKGRALEGARLPYLMLLQAVTAPGLDVTKLDQIIQTDVSIAHRFMKYLGSASFGFRGTVSNVRQGLVLLGKEETRRWVSLMALLEMGHGKPQEILVSAAVRAKHCELLGEEAGMSDRTPDLFLLGGLSLVDAMLDQPMADALEELPLADDLKLALLGKPSQLRPVLEFVERYERGDWTTCAELGGQLGIPRANVLKRYREAVARATHALNG